MCEEYLILFKSFFMLSKNIVKKKIEKRNIKEIEEEVKDFWEDEEFFFEK